MIFIYLIITAVASTALARGSTECMFSELTEGRQYFRGRGQPLCFRLPNTDNIEMTLTKDLSKVKQETDLIFKVKNQTVLLKGEYVKLHGQNQTKLPKSGAFNIGKAEKKHSGNYTLELFRSNGSLIYKVTAHLQIQAPVSQPAVSYMCLSPEQMEVSCSSEGEGVQFSMSLDDQLLVNTSIHSLQTPVNCTVNTSSLSESTAKQDKSSVSGVLNGQRTGSLTCQVWNKVSRHETVIHLTNCKDFLSSPTIVTVVVIAGVTLLLVALYLGIKKLQNKPSPTTVNECNSEAEVVYTEVKVIRNMKKTRPNSHFPLND